MHPLYKQVETLDKRCCEVFGLSEEILMEHAALALCKAVLEKPLTSVLIVCGPGNNGADGLACARLLCGVCDVKVLLPLGVKSPLATLQYARAVALHVKVINAVEKADVVVDALFGSGQTRPLEASMVALIETLNAQDARKIACDIPTGLGVGTTAFQADVTVAMGALKEVLFLENAKSVVGKIVVAELGVPRYMYEVPSQTQVLSAQDMHLPHRTNPVSHKGDFGHVLVVGGEKEGAGTLAAMAAFSFGAGLVSYLGEASLPPHLMKTASLPPKTTAVVAGMGLGNTHKETALKALLVESTCAVVADADVCDMPLAQTLYTHEKPVVFTPHPKEFCALMKRVGLGEVDVETVQANRLALARQFSLGTKSVLVLKGVHTLVAHKGEVYLCPYGSPALSKGGSGDVLAGMIGALLAQGYAPKEAAITAVLAHALAAQAYEGNTYALTPERLIEGVACLKNG
ncbi:MAG: NAD(P)H-hydrate dehydratase [Campylobacterales bacterium]|nr:NAD(P)H-hydrate dehydratase [Campylobacterales bacterium]